ncbi:hypothetical protein Tco_0995358 [Tanacetum coccineum]
MESLPAFPDNISRANMSRNKVELKATIMDIAESNNKEQIPMEQSSGILTKKSFLEKPAVRMDKNTSNAVLDANSTVIAIENTIVVITAAVMLDDSALLFIKLSPSFTNFSCSLVKTIPGVSLRIFS